jgi:hypothetical protein
LKPSSSNEIFQQKKSTSHEVSSSQPVEAIKLEPNHPTEKSNSHEVSCTQLDEAIKLVPDHPTEKSNSHEVSCTQLDEAIKLVPDLPTTKSNSHSLIKLKQPNQAHTPYSDFEQPIRTYL